MKKILIAFSLIVLCLVGFYYFSKQTVELPNNDASLSLSALSDYFNAQNISWRVVEESTDAENAATLNVFSVLNQSGDAICRIASSVDNGMNSLLVAPSTAVATGLSRLDAKAEADLIKMALALAAVDAKTDVISQLDSFKQTAERSDCDSLQWHVSDAAHLVLFNYQRDAQLSDPYQLISITVWNNQFLAEKQREDRTKYIDLLKKTGTDVITDDTLDEVIARSASIADGCATYCLKGALQYAATAETQPNAPCLCLDNIALDPTLYETALLTDGKRQLTALMPNYLRNNTQIENRQCQIILTHCAAADVFVVRAVRQVE